MHVVRFPGATYIAAGSHRILFGTFPEVHQHLMKQGLAWPDAVVFTDALVRDRLPQMVPEFLFFGHVFFNQNFDWATLSIKQRLILLGTERQMERAAKLMDISYLGMTQELLARDLDPERAAFLRRECDYFALKNKAGEVIPTSDYLDLRTWDEAQTAWLDDVRITRTGLLSYEVEHGGERLDVDVADVGLQGPTWGVPDVPDLHAARPYSVRILGSAGAFQHVAPSTSYLMTLNGDHYLIDCSPYVHRTLEQMGIATDLIRGIFISHIHDDHTGDLVAFALSHRRIDLYTTREVWESLKIKLSCLIDVSEQAIEDYFRFREIRPGEPLMLAGAQIDFHDACHSVPCVGMSLKVGDDELVITSDTSGHRQLLDMREKGIIDQARFEALEQLLDGQQVIVDCGEALIHGYIQDFLHRERRDNLVLAHRHSLPEEYQDVFSLAHPLQCFELGPKDEAALDTTYIGRALEAWQLSDLSSWVERFADHYDVREPRIGEEIISQGALADASSAFYVITHGLFDVLVDGTKVARLKAGDFFGEQAFINPDGRRLASVVATAPARLLAISGEHFQTMLHEEERHAHAAGQETLAERLFRLWENREVISRAPIFEGLDVHTLNAFSLRLERVQKGPSEVVIEQGSQDDSACYLVMRGSLQVENSDFVERPILRENDLFGEGLAGGFTSIRTATVRTLEPCTLLKLSHQDLTVIGHTHPHVIWALRDLAQQRQYLPAV